MTSTPRPESQVRDRERIRDMLAAVPLFAALPQPTLDDLVEACEVVSAPGGTYLLRAGQPADALYGILHGTLRVLGTTDTGERTEHDLYRGAFVGLLGVFIDRPMPTDALLVRDGVVVRLERSRVLELMQRHPELLRGFVELLSETAFALVEAAAGLSQPAASRRCNLAFVSVGPEPVTQVGRELIDIVLAEPGTSLVTAEIVDRALGAGSADMVDCARVTAWLDNLENESRSILYVADPGRPQWTARCARQSDRLVIVGPSNDPNVMAATLAIGLAKSKGLERRVELICVHGAGAELPSNTRRWPRSGDGTRLYHVRQGLRGDIQRVARHLLDRPVSVVLSGGGARGLSHLGVLAALVEAEVPIDAVGGTSVGSIFAAGLARGWSISHMRAIVEETFTPLFAIYDLTVPISSLLAGKKLDRLLQRLFADADIEDLWLPFFCVSTDLSGAELVVHDRGCLWKSVRASCGIPGLFPPLAMDGRSLVDGGLMDNLPFDLMAERCGGPIIAVDVFPYGEPTFATPTHALVPRIRPLRSRIKEAPASPPLFDILMRSTLVGSKFRQQIMARQLDQVIHLSPPVVPFGILNWRAYESLFAAGYDYARAQLSGGWRARLPRAA